MQSISILSAAVAAALVVVPSFGAELREQPKAVLELFTSQGCNSCPQADALFETLSQRKDLITLAYHVDYWDYIGWKDTFGSPENTERQRGYAKSWGSSRIFTPQLVVNGRAGVVGSRPGEVNGAIGGARLQVPVDLTIADGMIEIDVAGLAGGHDATVWLVTYADRQQVSIERGENAGKVIDYISVVTGKQVLGMWDPKDGSSFKLPLAELLTKGSDGLVVMIQEENKGLPGPIVGAASYQL